MALEFSLQENAVPCQPSVIKCDKNMIVSRCFKFSFFKGGVSSLLYNVVVVLYGKLKAIHVSLNLLVCIKILIQLNALTSVAKCISNSSTI